METDLLTGLKKNYYNYLEDVLSNRSLCTQLKFNLLKNYFNKIIETIEKLFSKKKLFKSLLSVNKVNNLFLYNNNNNNQYNYNNNNIGNNMNNNNNDDILINNNMNNIFYNNIDIDNMNDNIMDNNYINNMNNNIINNIHNNNNINEMNNKNNMNEMNNNNNMNEMNNNNNINMNNNNNIMINTSRKKYYVLKIDGENMLIKILTYLDNIVISHYYLCTEQIENNKSTFWLLIYFVDRFQLCNDLVFNSIYNVKGYYHSSDYRHFVLSKGKQINIKKYKFH